MREKVINVLLCAFVSGIVSYIVVHITERQIHTTLPDSLSVKKLEVVDSITIRSPEGMDEAVVLRNDGLIFAKNKIITDLYLGKQFTGCFIVGNRVLVSPNDLIKDPIESLEFMGELGVNKETGGGELLIRSAKGGNHVGNGAQNGQFAQILFDQNEVLQFFVHDNVSKALHVFLDSNSSLLERGAGIAPIQLELESDTLNASTQHVSTHSNTSQDALNTIGEQSRVAPPVANPSLTGDPSNSNIPSFEDFHGEDFEDENGGSLLDEE